MRRIHPFYQGRGISVTVSVSVHRTFPSVISVTGSVCVHLTFPSLISRSVTVSMHRTFPSLSSLRVSVCSKHFLLSSPGVSLSVCTKHFLLNHLPTGTDMTNNTSFPIFSHASGNSTNVGYISYCGIKSKDYHLHWAFPLLGSTKCWTCKATSSRTGTSP